jgi:glycosyl transferase family 87
VKSSEERAALVDVLLYGGSALFAASVALTASIPQYREWGRIAFGAYVAGALAVLAVRPRASVRIRTWVAAAVFAAAALVPLGLEATWRSTSGAGLHAQSEVLVVEEAAKALLDGRDPYAATFLHGSLAARPYGTRTHFPYLPGMAAFGLPRALDGRTPLADARVWFALVTLAALALAVAARGLRTGPGALLRCTQVLLILPTGALFLATGGDDIPVLGLMLASVTLLNRGRGAASGLLAGLAACLKQTAWPMLPFLFLAAGRDRRRFAVPLIGLLLVLVLPFALWDPAAFVEDAVRFPLGLGRQGSAAGTPTVGSILVRALPFPRGAVVVLLAGAVGAVAVWLLLRSSTRTVRGAVANAGLLSLVAMVLAPSGRAGYLLYPINLFVWARFAAPESASAATVEDMQRPSPLTAG